jgi:2'-5' RNA ligase
MTAEPATTSNVATARSSNRHRLCVSRFGGTVELGGRPGGGYPGPMVQSVELLLDDRCDQLVSGEWVALIQARLPSQGRHTGESNRPHITLGVAAAISPAAEVEIAQALGPIPFPVQLSGLRVFTGRWSILVRAVVESPELLVLHRQIHHAMRDCPGLPTTLAPGSWTPHVTLARRMSVEQVDQASHVLSPLPDIHGLAVSVRRWDSDARRTWNLEQT